MQAQSRFQGILRRSAISLWEGDIAELRVFLKSLAQQGVTDIGAHLDAHPELLREAARRIRIVDVNDSAMALAEADDRQQLLGPLADQLDLDDPVIRADIREGIVLIATGGTRAAREAKLVTRAGRTIDIFRLISLPEESDPSPRVLVSVVDITAHARASEERYRSLIENLGEGIAIVDADERLLFANRAAESVFGVGPGGLVGRNLREFLSDEDFAHARQETEKRRRGATSSYEMKVIRSDGSMRTLDLTATPQHDGAGRFVATLGVFRDVTEERRTKEALRRSEERLAQGQKMEAVGRLAGGIAHDFNNLLTVIRGYTDIVDEGLPPMHPLKADAREIKRAAERAGALIAQLLAFSRRQVLTLKVLDLNEIVSGMENMLQRLIGEDIELRTALDPGIGPVKADRSQVEQVLMNLAANARDAMPDGGLLRITTLSWALDETMSHEHPEMAPGDYVTLEVSDTGTGIDPKTLPRIFEPFFTTKEPGRGTGLGLATVYGIIKQSGGFIYCVSQPGMGTIFTIHLPRAGEGNADTAPGTCAPGPRPGNETVLVVEDEEAIRTYVLTILEKNGYAALGVRSAVEALSLLETRREPVDLLIIDVVMPGMSGLELGRRLMSADPGRRILYMSGYMAYSAVSHGLGGVPVSMLRKPFIAAELLRKVRQTLDGERP